jgi:acyl carrier protein
VKDLQEQVIQWLLEWFSARDKFKGDPAALVHTNYFDAGLLTSLEVIEFVTEIENQFGVQFSEQDFQDVRFVTIAGLSEMVAQQAAKAGQQM